MSRFDSFKFKYWDAPSSVVSLIQLWTPADCHTEKDYENSLYEYLRSALPSIVITPQYAFGRARTDLVVGNKVAIEIKKDFNDTSEFQRLLGQITQFRDWNGEFLVLLVGSTDPNLIDELRKHTRDQRVTVIEKQIL